MRAIHYSLFALAVIAALAISVVLLQREFASETPRTERRAAETPPASNAAPATRSTAPSPSVDRAASTSAERPPKSAESQSPPPPATASQSTPAAPADVVERAFADAPSAPPPAQPRRPGSAFDPLVLPPAGTIAPQARAPEPRTQDVRTQDTRTQEARIPEPPPRPQQQQRPAPAGPLALSREQQERIRNILLSHNIMQSPASEFPLQVGALVPPEVELMPLPPENADAIPNYRGYSYVISQDRIVIVVTEKRAISLLIPM
jgi:hypothetical protein